MSNPLERLRTRVQERVAIHWSTAVGTNFLHSDEGHEARLLDCEICSDPPIKTLVRLMLAARLLEWMSRAERSSTCPSELSTTTVGARNRMRKCNCVSGFVLGGEVDEDSHVYPADPQIELRFSEWAMDAMLLLLSMYEHVYVEHCPASIQQSTEDYIADGNVMTLFAEMYIKRATKDDHCKVKDAEMKWPDFITAVERQGTDVKFRDLTKLSKEGFRHGLQTVLKTACPEDPRPIGGKNHKSAFRGWVRNERDDRPG